MSGPGDILFLFPSAQSIKPGTMIRACVLLCSHPLHRLPVEWVMWSLGLGMPCAALQMIWGLSIILSCDHTLSNRTMPWMCPVGLIENDMIAISISHHLFPFLSVIQYPKDPQSRESIAFWSRFSFGKIASNLFCRKHTLRLWLSWQDQLSFHTSKSLTFPSLWWTQTWDN